MTWNELANGGAWSGPQAREVIRLARAKMSVRQIAIELDTTERTVERWASGQFAPTREANRAALVKLALARLTPVERGKIGNL